MLSRPTGPSSGGDRTRMGNRRGRRRHAATSVRRSGSNFLGGRCKSPCVAWGSNDAGLPGKAYDQSTESTHRFPVACEAPLLAGLCLAMGEPRTASQDELFARRLPLSCEAPLGRDRPQADLRVWCRKLPTNPYRNLQVNLRHARTLPKRARWLARRCERSWQGEPGGIRVATPRASLKVWVLRACCRNCVTISEAAGPARPRCPPSPRCQRHTRWP